LPVVPTTTGPEMIVMVWLVLLPAHVAVVVVDETEDVGRVVVPPGARLTRSTTAATTMRNMTPTEIQTTVLFRGVGLAIGPPCWSAAAI
jgi:hypothetical protein